MYAKDVDASSLNILCQGSKESKSKIPHSRQISFEADPFAIMMDELYPVMGSSCSLDDLSATES